MMVCSFFFFGLCILNHQKFEKILLGNLCHDILHHNIEVSWKEDVYTAMEVVGTCCTSTLAVTPDSQMK